MVVKLLYIACVLIICVFIYFKIRQNENSLIFIITTGIIATVLGNLIIPSNISLFEIFNYTNDAVKNKDIIVAQQSKNTTFSDEMYSNITNLASLGCSELKEATNAQVAADELLNICINQPESLAAVVSVFPNSFKAAGLTETNPLAIEELLESDGGGDLQKELVGALSLILDHPSTEYAYGKFSGSALTLDMCIRDENLDITPENVYLAWSAIELDNSPALIVTIHVKDCEPETGIFDLRTGFQPIIEFHALP